MLSNEDKSSILRRYRGLSYDTEHQMFFGKIYITGKDFYNVKIHTSVYPGRFPVVEEVGGRIPQSLHRHKYNNGNVCCLTTHAMGQVLLKTKIKTIESFFKEMVLPYFKNNSFYEINRKYFKDEYSHDIQGVWEGYQDILGIKNPYQILNILTSRMTGKKIKLRDVCYCGGGLTLKKCNHGKHAMNYRRLRLISLDIIKNDADGLDRVLSLPVN
jgi:hypothetical protein